MVKLASVVAFALIVFVLWIAAKIITVDPMVEMELEETELDQEEDILKQAGELEKKKEELKKLQTKGETDEQSDKEEAVDNSAVQ